MEKSNNPTKIARTRFIPRAGFAVSGNPLPGRTIRCVFLNRHHHHIHHTAFRQRHEQIAACEEHARIGDFLKLVVLIRRDEYAFLRLRAAAEGEVLVKRLFVVAVKVRQQLCDNLHVHGDLRVRQKTADIRGLAVNHHFRADVPAARDRAVRQIHRLNRHAEERRRQVAARLLNRLLHLLGEEVRQAQDDRGVLV